MTTRTNIYIALGVTIIVTASLATASVWSNYKTGGLENAVAEARTRADAADRNASLSDTEAARYKQKIEYLEAQLTEIQTIARKQDEQLEIFSADSRRARDAVRDARRTRAIAVTTAELCQKLAELGHPCE